MLHGTNIPCDGMFMTKQRTGYTDNNWQTHDPPRVEGARSSLDPTKCEAEQLVQWILSVDFAVETPPSRRSGQYCLRSVVVVA